jgi:O-antigen/teichoic acid export membrane protein
MSRRFTARQALRPLPLWTRLWLADSALLLVSQALTIAATSMAAILIARHLEPRNWGIFSGFLGLSLALSVVIQFGTGTWLLRELSRVFATAGPDAGASAARLVNAALVLNGALAGAVLAGGVTVAKIRDLDADVTLGLAALLAYSGLIAASYLMESHLRAHRRIRRVAAATIVEKYLLLMLVFASAATGGGIAGIGLAYVAAATVRVIFIRRSVYGGGAAGARLPALADIVRVFRGSLPFAATSGCLEVFPKLDTFFLLALSATSAGYFALGDRLLGPAIVFQDVLSTALYPFFARSAERVSPPWVLAAVFASAGGALGMAAAFAAPFFVPLIFGANYANAVPAVRVFALALPLMFAIGPLRVYGYAQDQEKRIVVVAFAASIAGTTGILTGQWAMGVVAAAGAYVLRQLLFLSGLVLICIRAGTGGGRTEAVPTRGPTIEAASP